MALSTAEVLIRWRSEGVDKAKADTAKIGQALQSVGQKATQIGGILSATVTAPLVLMGKSAIDAASDLNESMSAVQTVFGDSAQSILDFSRTSASALGQSRQSVLQASSALGALFKGIGLGEPQMAEFSEGIVTAAGDLASFYNVDPGEALQNLRSGLVGEAEPLRKFGILLNEAALESKALELGLARTKDEMTESDKVQARYAIIMEQLGAAQGDFARTSDSLANKQRILTARMQDMRAEIGGFLLPYALQLSDVFSRLLDRFLALDEPTKRLAVTIGAVAAAAGPALVIFGQILSTVGKLAPVMTLLTGPLGIVAAAVAGFALAWSQNWFGVRDITMQVVNAIGPIIQRIGQFFQAAKERGLDPFALAFRTLIVSLGERLGADHPIVDFLQEVYRLGRRLGEAFANRDFGAFVDELERAGTRLGTWLEEQAGKAATFGADLFNRMVAGVRDINWAVVGETLADKMGDLFSWRQSILEQAAALGSFLLARVVGGIRSVNWPLVGETVRDNLGRFADWVGDRLGDALLFGRSLLDALINGLRGVNWSAVGTFVQVSLQTAIGILRDLGGWVIDRLREVDWDGVKRTLGDFGALAIASLTTAARNALLALKDLGTWVLDRIREVDWSVALQAMSDAGLGLIQDLSNGMAKQLDTLDVWITGGGDEAGVGSRILTAIAASINAVRETLVSVGSGAVRSIADGFWAAWDAFVEAVINTPFPNPGGDIAGRDRETVGPGTDPNKPSGQKALGGAANRTILVGERGPELVTVPSGSYVTPHGASMGRLGQMFAGFARGGAVVSRADFNDWTGGMFPEFRRAARDLLKSGRLTYDLMGFLSEGGNMAGWPEGRLPGGRRPGGSTEDSAARRFARRSGRTRPGFTLAEDGSWVPNSFYSEPARRSREEREARQAERAAREEERLLRQQAAAERDRILRLKTRRGEDSTDEEIERARRRERRYFGGENISTTTSRREAAAFYGPVTFVMTSANIAREIERQLATGRRA